MLALSTETVDDAVTAHVAMNHWERIDEIWGSIALPIDDERNMWFFGNKDVPVTHPRAAHNSNVLTVPG